MDGFKGRVRTFIVDNFLFGDGRGFSEEESFLENGIVDSTGILELVDFLEREFAIKISDEELIPENLDSLVNIDAFLRTKLVAVA